MRLFPKAGPIVLLVAAVGAFALALTTPVCSTFPGAGDCEAGVSPVALLVAALLAATAALAWRGRLPFAWAAWGLAAALTLLYGFSHGFLVLPCAVSLMGLLLSRRPRPRPEAEAPAD